MATITKRRCRDGLFSYTAQIRLKRSGKVIHSEARTLSKRAAVAAWARRREEELTRPGALQKAVGGELSLAGLIGRYEREFEPVQRWQRSKRTHLDFLKRQPIAALPVTAITPQLLVDHARRRRLEGAGPSTVANDLIWLGVVLKAGQHVFHLPVDGRAAEDARAVCKEHRLIAKSSRRARRPTADELARLLRHFRGKARQRIPMDEIVMFAAHSSRREAEITRLRRADYEPRHATILVRDVKHPTRREGNHRLSKLTPEAVAILKRQPRRDERFFPYDPRSISAAFTRACKLLGIEDLRFHDLRHEATSRLFERGYEIQEVAQFTLHESWADLKRYTQLKPHQVRRLGAAGQSLPRGRLLKSARATSGRRGGGP